MTTLHRLAVQASFNSGHLFIESDNNSLIDDLAHLLTQYGVKNVQARTHNLTFRAGTQEGKDFYGDVQHLFQVSIPFFQKWAQFPNDYEKIYQQMLKETRQPDFVGEWTLLTGWGNV